MAILGLAKDDKKTKATKSDKNQQASNDQAADEAKKMLEEMEAKKAAGGCPFC